MKTVDFYDVILIAVFIVIALPVVLIRKIKNKGFVDLKTGESKMIEWRRRHFNSLNQIAFIIWLCFIAIAIGILFSARKDIRQMITGEYSELRGIVVSASEKRIGRRTLGIYDIETGEIAGVTTVQSGFRNGDQVIVYYVPESMRGRLKKEQLVDEGTAKAIVQTCEEYYSTQTSRTDELDSGAILVLVTMGVGIGMIFLAIIIFKNKRKKA